MFHLKANTLDFHAHCTTQAGCRAIRWPGHNRDWGQTDYVERAGQNHCQSDGPVTVALPRVRAFQVVPPIPFHNAIRFRSRISSGSGNNSTRWLRNPSSNDLAKASRFVGLNGIALMLTPCC